MSSVHRRAGHASRTLTPSHTDTHQVSYSLQYKLPAFKSGDRTVTLLQVISGKVKEHYYMSVARGRCALFPFLRLLGTVVSAVKIQHNFATA